MNILVPGCSWTVFKEEGMAHGGKRKRDPALTCFFTFIAPINSK